MKLLVVDHNALDPANRVLYERIVGLGGIELRLLVPERWFNNYGTLRFTEPRQRLCYEIVASDVLFHSRTHRLIYSSLAKHLDEFRPDVLYMNAEPENFQTCHAAHVNDRLKAKFVFSSWRNIDHPAVGYPYALSFLHKKIEEFVLRRACHGIVFNPTAASLYARNGFDRVTFIPPAVNLEAFQPDPTPRRRKGFTVGYAGRLVRPKGVDILLQAIAQLPDPYAAIIIGNGPEKEHLQHLVDRLHIAGRVEFGEAGSAEEMRNFLVRMDVLVLPSRTTRFWREQFGRVLTEAMACGVPVIGSSSGEIPFVIGGAGLVFREGEIEDLSCSIRRISSDETLRAALRDRGEKRVKELFSLEVVAAHHHRLFLSL